MAVATDLHLRKSPKVAEIPGLWFLPNQRDRALASAASLRKAWGCSFTEVIELMLFQMEEAKVSRVECPTCLAVRDIQPKGEIVKFPWHPKRVTSTPNHSLRWVKRESAWRLSE